MDAEGEGQGEETKKWAALREERRKKEASADRAACPALYSAIRYDLQRGPMYLPSCPGPEPTSFTTQSCLRPVQLCGSTTPVPVDQFLFQAVVPLRLQRRWLTASVSQLASQPAVLALALMRFTERRK